MNAETKTRKDPVRHVDVLKGTIDFAIPIDAMSQDDVKRANDLINAARKVFTDAKAHEQTEASFGRKPGTLFP